MTQCDKCSGYKFGFKLCDKCTLEWNKENRHSNPIKNNKELKRSFNLAVTQQGSNHEIK